MMFERLKDYRGIVVTGPHRSGTTITGRMIAYDLDRLYVTESQIQEQKGRNITPLDIEAWMDRQREPFVLHGATCFAWLTELQRFDIATVFVHRPDAEIIASQKRAGLTDVHPSQKKHRWRELVERKIIRHPYDVHYHQHLRDHPLWVEDRDGWEERQIGPEETAFTTEGGRA